MHQEHSSNREALGFKHSVLRSFNFLLDNNRFSCVEANNYMVRFESPDIIVLVSHDPQSYEISANIELRNNSEVFASVEEIAMISGPSDLQYLGNCEAASAELVNFIVSELAKLLRKHGLAALRGEQGVFEQAKVLRSQRAAVYTQTLRVDSALVRSEEAWRRKDYREVVDLLTPCREWLTNVQVKRLEYAQKQLGKAKKQDTITRWVGR